jgi:hypothetical protein
LSIRAGNLLGAIVYLGAGFVLLRLTLPSKWSRCLGMVIWIANPYLAEFFALSRGYGLCVAMEAAAICCAALYLHDDFQARRYRYLTAAMVFAALSVWANFAALHFYLAFVAVLGSQMLRHWRAAQRERAILLNVTLSLALLIVLPISRIKKAGDFTWFGNQGFLKDTVQGFLDCFLLGKRYFGANTLLSLQSLLVAIFVISSVVAGALLWKNKGKITPLAWLIGLFPATVLTNLLVTIVTDSSYLSTRTTLFFAPLVCCSAIGLLGLLEKKFSKTALGIAALLASVLSIHFVKNANWTYAYEWRYDRDTYTVLNAIEQKYKSENRTAPWSLHTHCLQWPSFLFHVQLAKSRYRNYLEDPKDAGCEARPPDGKDAEFYYLPKEKAAPFAQHYEVMLETSDGERVLLRRKP